MKAYDEGRRGEVRCKSRTAATILAGALLLPASAYLAGCGSQAAVQSAAQPSKSIGISQDSTTTMAGATRTITSSTELTPPPTGSTPVMWLINGDAPAAGIQIDEARGGPGPVPG